MQKTPGHSVENRGQEPPGDVLGEQGPSLSESEPGHECMNGIRTADDEHWFLVIDWPPWYELSLALQSDLFIFQGMWSAAFLC